MKKAQLGFTPIEPSSSFNSNINKLYRLAQSTCSAILTSGLDNIITTLITIAVGLLTAYSMGGF